MLELNRYCLPYNSIVEIKQVVLLCSSKPKMFISEFLGNNKTVYAQKYSS